MNEALIEIYGKLFVHCWSSYAIQQGDGRYWRVREPVTHELLAAHLRGVVTLGTYLLNEDDTCTFAVFDADGEDGLSWLVRLSGELRREGVPTLLEASRRGGHLWVHFDVPTPAGMVRSWLLPYAQGYGMELYPKQDARLGGVGSLIRLPLGVHRRSRGWYPFLVASHGLLWPVGQTVEECCQWVCASVERVTVPVVALETSAVMNGLPLEASALVVCADSARPGRGRIRAWCRAHDVRAVIGRYVVLSAQGASSSGGCASKFSGVS